MEIYKIKIIPKPNKDPNEINYYRPISLTSWLMKILEKLIAKKLVDYLDENKIIDLNQAGF